MSTCSIPARTSSKSIHESSVLPEILRNLVYTWSPCQEASLVKSDPLMFGGYFVGDTTIMVANSFYLGDPGDPITILTRAADFTIISQEVVEIVTNDISTGTLTITPALTLDHPIDIANGITTYVLQGDLSTQLAQSQTVQSRPVILSTTTDTEFNNDDETLEIVHRTTRGTT